jgi:hypothetical protein
MASSTENVKLGVCNVLYDGVNLGFTKGGVEVEVTTSTHEIKVDQFGETPIGELINGRVVKAKVPLAETTLDNLLTIMPGSTLVSDGSKATGTVTFSSAAPVNNDSVTIDGVTFIFKTSPTPGSLTEMAIPASVNAAGIALRDAIAAYPFPYQASVLTGVVTVTAKQRGVAYNGTITKVGTNIAVVGLSGGVDPTKAKVVVSTGVSVNLLTVAKTLILRPKGTSGAEDFTIFKAACPGAMSFSYTTDAERVFTADFKGYALDTGELFAVGDVSAA